MSCRDKMIEYIKGNILDTDAQAVVNPVNCKGVMGAGLAEQFKNKYPHIEEEYKKLCRDKTITLTHPAIISLNSVDNPKYMILFPTKDYWGDSSQITTIRVGLQRLASYTVHNYYLNTGKLIRSIAFPKIGCGLGKLNWKDVEPLLIKFEKTINNVLGVKVIVYDYD